MINNIKDFLYRRMRGKWATIEEILNHCETYYSNPKPSLNATLQAKWNSDWCEYKVVNRKNFSEFERNNTMGDESNLPLN